MAYKCLQPLTHDSRAFAPGEKIPNKQITPKEATVLIELGVLSLECKARKSEKDKRFQLPDLEAMSQEEALDVIAEEQRLSVLHRLQEEEKRGRRRPRVLGALKKQILTVKPS